MLRQQKGWSLSEASLRSGVSKAMLGQIERGESSPTIAILWKIATGFDTSFSRLVNNSEPLEAEVLLINANLARKPVAEDGMVVAVIQPYQKELGFEWFEITFPENYERLSEAHQQGVTEFISVVEGTISIQIEGCWQTLGPGETLRFSADQTHGYRTNMRETAVVHCIMHYADR
jgi:XRE family transcriptional regulator, regulator of sulfur utilization